MEKRFFSSIFDKKVKNVKKFLSEPLRFKLYATFIFLLEHFQCGLIELHSLLKLSAETYLMGL